MTNYEIASITDEFNKAMEIANENEEPEMFTIFFRNIKNAQNELLACSGNGKLQRRLKMSEDKIKSLLASIFGNDYEIPKIVLCERIALIGMFRDDKKKMVRFIADLVHEGYLEEEYQGKKGFLTIYHYKRSRKCF